MARRLGSTPFQYLLPENLARDETMARSAAALDEVLNSSIAALPQILLHARLARDAGIEEPVGLLPPLSRLAALAGGLATLPGEVLDLLAWQFHVEAYDTAVGLQARRELIFQSILLHRRRGTPWAVTQALATALRVPSSISEWFEYDSEPYFFRIHLDVTGQPVDEKWLQSAFQIIQEYKNVRSWLELLRTAQTITLERHRAAGTLRQHTGSRNVLYFPPAPPVPQNTYTGVGASGATHARVVLAFPEPTQKMSLRSGLATVGITSARLNLFFPPPGQDMTLRTGVAMFGGSLTLICQKEAANG